MKRLLFLCCAVLPLFMYSCKDEPTLQQQLVGKWMAQAQSSYLELYEFRSDGTGYYYNHYRNNQSPERLEEYDFRYTVKGSILTLYRSEGDMSLPENVLCFYHVEVGHDVLALSYTSPVFVGSRVKEFPEDRPRP